MQLTKVMKIEMWKILLFSFRGYNLGKDEQIVLANNVYLIDMGIVPARLGIFWNFMVKAV